MPLVMDIEAAGLPEDEIPPAFRDSLKRKADKDGVDWLTLRGLHGLSSQIVCLGMLNSDHLQGTVATTGDGHPPVTHRYRAPEGVLSPDGDPIAEYVIGTRRTSEVVAIHHFWDEVTRHNLIVTFNGTGYDIPMLLQRGALHGIRPSRHLLMPSWKNNLHLDLFELLSCRDWRFKASLAAWCEAFGIENPKGDIAGANVTEAFEQGRINEIAEYNARDLVATDRLARKVVPLLEGRVL